MSSEKRRNRTLNAEKQCICTVIAENRLICGFCGIDRFYEFEYACFL